MTALAAPILAIAIALLVGFLVGVRRERHRVDAIFGVAMRVVVSPTIQALYSRFVEYIDDAGLADELRKIVLEKEERRRIREGSRVE